MQLPDKNSLAFQDTLNLKGDVRKNLLFFAEKYIWWKTPEESLAFPNRIIAQVMEMGTFTDTCILLETLGPESLVDVIKNSEPGYFSPRSWHYWHFRLELADIGQVPPLPKRVFT